MSSADAEIREQLGLFDKDVAFLGGLWLDAWNGEFAPIRWLRELQEDEAASPRHISPIETLNHWTHGGVYGITALGGDPGAGKSFFAMRTALDAAMDEDHPTAVCYLAAEMTEQQMKTRLEWMARETGRLDRLPDVLRSRLHLFEILSKVSDEELGEMIYASFVGEPRGLLVVDSLNSMLSFLKGRHGEDYWTLFERVIGAFVACRRLTEGRFSALILSELNRDGVSKGRSLEYKSDLMLNFKNTKVPRVVKIAVNKNREQGSDGLMGEFKLNDHAAFETA